MSKNHVDSSIFSSDIADFKILRSDWIRALWLNLAQFESRNRISPDMEFVETQS